MTTRAPKVFTQIVGEIRDMRVVIGRAAFTDVEFTENRTTREREILVTRRYVQLVEQMDEAARVPEWGRLASALQGTE